MNKPSISQWSTRNLSYDSRYEAWADVLNAHYGTWHAARPESPVFNADVEKINNGSFTLIKCICDPCAGMRSERLARASREEFAAFQLVLAGQELIELEGKTIELGKGDLLVWDSTRARAFEVTKKLSKVSLMMPLDQLRRWLPEDWRGVSGMVPQDSASYLLLRSYMTALARPDFRDREFCGTAMLDAGLAMLAGGARSPLEGGSSLAEGQLRSIKDFIRANLRDPELSLTQIAEHRGISLRYLHWLFGQSHQTAAAWILEARLNACRNDLLNPAMAKKTISNIAYQWGFNSAAHFSRSYRARFGESASETRQQKLGGKAVGGFDGDVSASVERRAVATVRQTRPAATESPRRR